MKKLAAMVVVLSSMCAGYFAWAAERSDRPAGVDAANWIQVTDTVGFVVVPEKKSGPVFASGGLLLEPAAYGYFMAKSAGGWRRLAVIEPIKGPATSG